MRVLDVGCGTGAMTAGLAEVGAIAVGLDRDPSLLAQAPMRENLSFVQGDVLTMEIDSEFDTVATARCLQWIESDKLSVALNNLVRAVKPGGLLVVLDYDHTAHRWTPEPPSEFRAFFDAFLGWRAANGCHNSIAVELPDMLVGAGLVDVQMTPAHEHAARGDAASDIWPHVMESLGPMMVETGFITEEQRTTGLALSREWMRQRLDEQVLWLAAVEGRRPQ